MGATFAPSLANLFMSSWELDNIYKKQWNNLLYYKWYINYILLLWRRDEASLLDFMYFLNNNNNRAVTD